MSVGILLFLTYTRLVPLLSALVAALGSAPRQLLQSWFNQLTCSTHTALPQSALRLRPRLWLRLRWRQQEGRHDIALFCLLKLICQCQVLCFIFPFGFFLFFPLLFLFFSVKLFRTHLPPSPPPAPALLWARTQRLHVIYINGVYFSLSLSHHACVWPNQAATKRERERESERADNRKRDKRTAPASGLTDTKRNFN